MRKQLFLIAASAVLTFVSFQRTHAQNASPYWSLSGNSNASNTTSKLGTTNAINLRMYTNNIERVRILSSNGNVGIGTTAPTERLHINSAAGTNAFRAQVNGSTKLLVHSNGGVTIGGSSTPPTNGLYISGAVGIGTAAPATGYKLHVVGKGQFTAGIAVPSGGVVSSNTSGNGMTGYGNLSSGIGVFGNGYYGVYGTGETFGLYGYTNAGYGVFGTGSDGVYGSGTDRGVYGGGGSYGVFGSSGDGTGVQGTSTNSYGGSFDSYNGFALRASTTFGSYAGVFYGNVYLSNGYTTSDKNLKQNVEEFSGAMSVINKLKPRHYAFKTDDKYAFLHLPKGTHYGLLAQDVEEVLPSLVSTSDHEVRQLEKQPDVSNRNPGEAVSAPASTRLKSATQKPETISIKAVNYTELIPLMLKGMQELDAKTERIAELERKNEELESRLQKLEALLTSSSLVTRTSAYLEQNAPNPVNGATTIRYHIPETSTSARLTLTNTKGQLIKAFTLNSRGIGQVNLNTQALASGSYTYTLYVDGKKVDIKRLVIVR